MTKKKKLAGSLFTILSCNSLLSHKVPVEKALEGVVILPYGRFNFTVSDADRLTRIIVLECLDPTAVVGDSQADMGPPPSTSSGVGEDTIRGHSS